MRLLPLVIAISVLSTGCARDKVREDTLADLDQFERQPQPAAQSLTASPEDARQAYARYLAETEGTDTVRLMALHRLAEMELETGLAKLHGEEGEAMAAEATATLTETTRLLETALRDFPQQEGNDARLYQLAIAYDTLGQPEAAISALERLAAQYPESVHIAETQFRLGEHYFAYARYADAERAYGVVLEHPESLDYILRSRYKRGWARFKQELYWEAIEDLYIVLEKFDEIESYGKELNQADRSIRQDGERALALSFAYLGGVTAIQDYFAYNPEDPAAARGYSVLGDLYVAHRRHQEAARIFDTYALAYPNAPQTAPLLLRSIANWEVAGDNTRALAARRDFNERFGAEANFWKAHDLSENRHVYQAAVENLKSLARHYHHDFQATRNPESLRMARYWYEHLLASYPAANGIAASHFLYGELLTEAGDHAGALNQYDIAFTHDQGAAANQESAFARVAASRQLLLHAADKDPQRAQGYIERVGEYLARFPDEPRALTSVVAAANDLYDKEYFEGAVTAANLLPENAPIALRFEATAVAGFAALQQREFARAENLMTDALAFETDNAKRKDEIRDGLAAAIYQQGAAAQDEGYSELAVSHYLRVRQAAPGTEAVVAAEYDAANLLIKASDWGAAIAVLERIRNEYPAHELSAEVSRKLAAAYQQTDRSIDSARELERVAQAHGDATMQHQALWQAAELYRKGGETRSALAAYAQFVELKQVPFEQGVQARAHLVTLYTETGDSSKSSAMRSNLISYEKSGGTARTAQTRRLAADAAIEIADEAYAAFAKLRLSLPLDTALRRKTKAMERAVAAYEQAADYGFTVHITRATHQLGEIYRDLSVALLQSERPRGLSPDDLDEYNILIEDQAFPFEEKALRFYETNAKRIKDGIYDESVAESLARLRTLYPARYDRTEKLEAFIAALE